jgi:hypothetical protein
VKEEEQIRKLGVGERPGCCRRCAARWPMAACGTKA